MYSNVAALLVLMSVEVVKRQKVYNSRKERMWELLKQIGTSGLFSLHVIYFSLRLETFSEKLGSERSLGWAHVARSSILGYSRVVLSFDVWKQSSSFL